MNSSRSVPYVEIPSFQGPMDLLLHLIQQEKVDIYDIPIARIADQFISAIKDMESLDMEVTSEFLVLAAQLLYIKSRMLLPKPPKETNEVEEDPRQELIERLLEYKAFKQASQVLGVIQTSSGQKYFREVDVEGILRSFPVEDPLNGVSFEDLWKAFRKVVERAEQGEEIRYVQPEEISIEDMTNDVLRRLVLQPKGLSFKQLIRANTKMEIVVTFLALLELLKLGKVRAEQPMSTGDIFLIPNDTLEFKEEE